MTFIGEAGVLWRAWDAFAASRLGIGILRQFRSKRNAVLLGSTGVGKSQFVLSIREAMAKPIPRNARTEFEVKTVGDVGRRLVEFSDLPGQKEHKPVRDRSVKRVVSLKKKPVFIVFVCAGYHEYGASADTVVSGGEVKEDYLQENYIREIEILNEMVNLLDDETIITVITKADVWWNYKNDVIKHYAEGDYAARIKFLYPRARHVIRPYSSIHKRFYGTPGSSTFDDVERASLRDELLRVIEESFEG